jgi:hypothetical protein
MRATMHETVEYDLIVCELENENTRGGDQDVTAQR